MYLLYDIHPTSAHRGSGMRADIAKIKSLYETQGGNLCFLFEKVMRGRGITLRPMMFDGLPAFAQAAHAA